MNNPTQDKSELIDEVLEKLLSKKGITYVTGGGTDSVREDRTFWTPKDEAKATLLKAFREVEIEGQLEQLNWITGLNPTSKFFKEIVDAQITSLTKALKKDKI